MVFNVTQLIAILFVVFHLYKINDHTIELALQIEAIPTQQIQSEEDNEEVMFSAIPRKITLFRCVMEKKLGIDWEHETSSSQSFVRQTLQTD